MSKRHPGRNTMVAKLDSIYAKLENKLNKERQEIKKMKKAKEDKESQE